LPAHHLKLQGSVEIGSRGESHKQYIVVPIALLNQQALKSLAWRAWSAQTCSFVVTAIVGESFSEFAQLASTFTLVEPHEKLVKFAQARDAIEGEQGIECATSNLPSFRGRRVLSRRRAPGVCATFPSGL
jgi:hypothetical protein